MKIRKINKFLQFFLGKEVVGITLFPFGIYVKEGYENNNQTINHEKIHWEQQIEMCIVGSCISLITFVICVGFDIRLSFEVFVSLCFLPFLFFYVWYIVEWLIKIPKYGPQAYFNISFEREAYERQKEASYLRWRSSFVWTYYLTKDDDHEDFDLNYT